MKQASTSTLPQLKRLNVRIDKALHRRTKRNADDADITIQAVAIRGLELANEELEATIAPQPKTAKEATNS